MSDARLTDEEYFASLPRKACGAGVLFFDTEGKLLIVDPNYKEGWGIPGGGVDTGESPHAAAVREVKEELGLTVTTLKLLAVDYLRATYPRPEFLYFIFDGGVLNADQIDAIVLEEKELDAYRFVEVSEALTLLNPRQANRLSACIEARKLGNVLYLEGGAPIEL